MPFLTRSIPIGPLCNKASFLFFVTNKTEKYPGICKEGLKCNKIIAYMLSPTPARGKSPKKHTQSNFYISL